MELDYELEIGAFVGPGNAMGQPISVADANAHIGGFCLLNDWSARDIQRWEYQPLGPFLAKNFATSVSPWMITWEALEPFRVLPPEHEVPVLPYLQTATAGAFDIYLEVWLRSARMPEPILVGRPSFRDMYWTFPQMIAHHTSNGCPLRAGDLIGSGTVSGPEKSNRGCLLELTEKGSDPLHLSPDEVRHFLENGDHVIFKGRCERENSVPIGFGVCAGTVLPALSSVSQAT
jgi:fumarylacetoacetase